jgi:hypothetical protein
MRENKVYRRSNLRKTKMLCCRALTLTLSILTSAFRKTRGRLHSATQILNMSREHVNHWCNTMSMRRRWNPFLPFCNPLHTPHSDHPALFPSAPQCQLVGTRMVYHHSCNHFKHHQYSLQLIHLPLQHKTLSESPINLCRAYNIDQSVRTVQLTISRCKSEEVKLPTWGPKTGPDQAARER